MQRLYDYVFDNGYKIDAREAEDAVRKKYPLLLHASETIELAFKDRGGKGRDKEYFTSHRILVKDGKGIGSKRKNYLSIPYDSIQAFSVQSAGAVLDGDCELTLSTNAVAYLSIDFASSNVNIFQIYQFFNTKIQWSPSQGIADYVDPVPPNTDKAQTSLGSAFDWLSDNAMQVDPRTIEEQFKTTFPILLADEQVELAFKSGRDTKIFTNRRMLLVNVKGLVGKQIDFWTIPYRSIHGFSVQTPGALLDRNSELRIFTSMLGWPRIDQNFRSTKVNLWAVQKLLCNHVLGEDKDPLPDVDRYEGMRDTQGGIFGILTGLRFNMRPIDAVMMNHVLHHDPPILQGSEVIEMAFQGHRDIAVFTTKRLITIDKKGLFAKKIEYMSIPWDKFVAFGTRSAGWMIDFDAEVVLYTEMSYHNNGDNPPTPGESCFELDFNKNCVDLFKLKYYLSRRIINKGDLAFGAPIGLEALTGASPDPNHFEYLLRWLGGDQTELDASGLNQEFHYRTKILLDEESVLMAFKGGRDITLFTNIRIMIINVQGLVGCKIEYTSVPYRSVHAYAVESAGIWDRDSELNLYTRNRWTLAKVDMDFRSGKTDIMQIQQLLSSFIVGVPTDPKTVFSKKNYGNHDRDAVGMNSLTAAFFDNSKEVDTIEIDARFHSEIPLLLEEEKVLRAFSQARDMFLYTDRRFIIVDRRGASGQRVKYKTIPYRHMTGFEFETAGHLDRDAEIYTYSNTTDGRCKNFPRSVGQMVTKQSILVKTTDIYEIGQLILDHSIISKISKKVATPTALYGHQHQGPSSFGRADGHQAIPCGITQYVSSNAKKDGAPKVEYGQPRQGQSPCGRPDAHQAIISYDKPSYVSNTPKSMPKVEYGHQQHGQSSYGRADGHQAILSYEKPSYLCNTPKKEDGPKVEYGQPQHVQSSYGRADGHHDIQYGGKPRYV